MSWRGALSVAARDQGRSQKSLVEMLNGIYGTYRSHKSHKSYSSLRFEQIEGRGQSDQFQKLSIVAQPGEVGVIVRLRPESWLNLNRALQVIERLFVRAGLGVGGRQRVEQVRRVRMQPQRLLEKGTRLGEIANVQCEHPVIVQFLGVARRGQLGLLLQLLFANLNVHLRAGHY